MQSSPTLSLKGIQYLMQKTKAKSGIRSKYKVYVQKGAIAIAKQILLSGSTHVIFQEMHSKSIIIRKVTIS